VGREKFLIRYFFNYIKIKNHKKWESEKNKTKLENGKKNKPHNISRILYGVSPPVYYTGNKRASHTRLIMRNIKKNSVALVR
jgi:hypothetical protein